MSILLDNKKDCAGCTLCAQLCPVKAISIEKDENGFIYPKIDNEKCLKCGMCKRNCMFQNNELLNKNISSYAFLFNNSIIKESSSGGAFAALAMHFINNCGTVYGCALIKEDNNLVPKHIRIDSIDKISILQGSKYVMSDLNGVFKNISDDLKEGKEVLFCGTPCQVASIKKYLLIKKANIEKLLTIDLICHGVPSYQFFQDYINFLNKKINGKIYNIKFRDKCDSWDLKGKIEYYDKRGKNKIKSLYNNTSSYYRLFLDGLIYRENCYNCKYAIKDRIGDITLGDFWGIEIEYPELLKKNNGKIDEKKGVSCVLINTNKGRKYFDLIKENSVCEKVSLEKIIKHNKQLNSPTKCNVKYRNKIFEAYNKSGYEGVEKLYIKTSGIKYYIACIYHLLPKSIRKIIRRKK